MAFPQIDFLWKPLTIEKLTLLIYINQKPHQKASYLLINPSLFRSHNTRYELFK